MPANSIADLPAPVTAAKADWLVASHWIGFTPAGDGPDAPGRCQATISSQAGNGYVIEYITLNFGTPKPAYLADPRYLAERAEHAAVAGRLVAVHRLRSSSLSLKSILGDADYERMQDMWDEDGRRRRWSVAFPIVESYEIPTKPLARDVLGPDAMQRVFAHPSATLRPLNDEERRAISSLPILLRPTANAWIGIQADIAAAERSEIETRISRHIDSELGDNAIEGMTKEQWVKVRRRAAWLAQKFIQDRQKVKTLRCDDCSFDPVIRANGTGIKPRSLLDVHHLHPLEEGRRVTTLADFKLLCPTCHRLEHALLRLGSAS
ncbi:HNH endonuclease [Sediminicoccus rosea]|uniref:HNH endonuclease n=1 Tax=Sediminicoccus rosea TaxID=1225128 RepID=A0ABZ0PQY4_9PROT|nr:HNH endonuclease [Sediminicoccus rosea]WPB87698.1 HNH endonuclease [Sediminicoccus rosea]